MMRAESRIAVIGGGVIGITTAVLLQANGHPTVLYTVAQPSDFRDASPSAFASLHAAASILPHSVASPRSTHWISISQEYFRILSAQGDTGVRTQRHYEIFEAAVSAPSYHAAVRDFEMLTDAELVARGAPMRPGTESVSGWSFSAFFCEAPTYLAFLYDLFVSSGGEVIAGSALPKSPRLTAYLAHGHSVCVLCAGQASPGLLNELIASGAYEDRPLPGAFEPLADEFEAKLIRGHYLSFDLSHALRDREGRAFSYNYTPTSDQYPTISGAPADVYCYPRAVGWLLGGSRQEGHVDEHGGWSGETTAAPEISFAGGDGLVAIPAPIFRLNRELLMSVSPFAVDLDRLVGRTPPRITAGVGYRFVRDNAHDNVRVAASRLGREDERFVVHNYGHGGAGYTLSWGSALDVLAHVDQLVPRAPSRDDRRAPVLGSVSELTARLQQAAESLSWRAR
jgi:D-amino-acid oxidase